MSKITYHSQFGPDIRLQIGYTNAVGREAHFVDICLTRSVAEDCPLEISILIRSNGDLDVWRTDWRLSHKPSPYWHFDCGSSENMSITQAQRHTLERIFLSLEDRLPAGLNGRLGAPVARLMAAGSSLDEIAARHGVPRPLLA